MQHATTCLEEITSFLVTERRVVSGRLPVAQRPHRQRELVRQSRGVRVPKIDGDLGERPQPILLVDGAAQHHRVAEGRPVVDPIEVDAQRRRRLPVQAAPIDQRRHRRGHAAGDLGEIGSLRQRRRGVVRLNDHARPESAGQRSPGPRF